jgi:1-aminocyclopropane-1-carboxylate deaminase/D-cysteine desulfhydrase-like pyridoxal-dependent ACC family enzyme
VRYVATETVPVDALEAYPGNARVHDEPALDESARTNGQYRSVVARRLEDGTLQLLAGHGTVGAFRRQGAARSGSRSSRLTTRRPAGSSWRTTGRAGARRTTSAAAGPAGRREQGRRIKSELGREGERLTLVRGDRDFDALDETSRKILAAGSGTSIFDPVLCELAYRWFSAPGHTVLDPFAGGSVRGLVAAMLGRRYIGNDLRAEQIDANREQADDFVRRGLIGGPSSTLGAITDPAATTPVERRGNAWVKRDDLFTVPGELGGVGGKVRSCLQLVTEAMRERPVKRLVTAGSRHSPQVVIVAAVAAHLGLDCTAHVPASKEASPELTSAAVLGASLVEHRPGYNTVIVARAREDADGDPWAIHVPFGMETPHAVSTTRAQAAALFDNWPEGARRLVVPVGSGMTLAGILAAARPGGPEIVGVQVGADPTDRLNRYAPAGWRKRVTLVKSELAYEERVVGAAIHGLELDPVYEAKCLPFLASDDVLWVVGRRPDAAVSPVGPPEWSIGDSAEWVDTLAPASADLIFTCPPIYGWRSTPMTRRTSPMPPRPSSSGSIQRSSLGRHAHSETTGTPSSSSATSVTPRAAWSTSGA